jgi:hypothetical protein
MLVKGNAGLQSLLFANRMCVSLMLVCLICNCHPWPSNPLYMNRPWPTIILHVMMQTIKWGLHKYSLLKGHLRVWDIQLACHGSSLERRPHFHLIIDCIEGIQFLYQQSEEMWLTWMTETCGQKLSDILNIFGCYAHGVALFDHSPTHIVGLWSAIWKEATCHK